MDSHGRAPNITPSSTRPAPGGQLAETHYYRPGSLLATVIILAPAATALTAAGISLLLLQRVLLWIPIVLLICSLLMLLTWFLMVRVRTTSTGIACARPWRPWQELPWETIERADSTGFRIILTGSSGRRGVFAPFLLRDGARLRREILVRISPHILDRRLRVAAQNLLADQVTPTPDGGLSGRLLTRPRTAARAAAAVLVALSVVGGIFTALYLRAYSLIAVESAAFLAVLAGVGAYIWLSQRLELSDAGIQVTFSWPPRTLDVRWDQIQLLEHTPAEHIIRLRGDVRLTCAGPTLMRSSDRDVMRAFLNAYCIERGVPVIQRLWLT